MEHSRELADLSPEREAIIAAKMARLLLKLERPELPGEQKAEVEEEISSLEAELVFISVRRAGLDRRYHSHAA
jgi:hypothetical protein